MSLKKIKATFFIAGFVLLLCSAFSVSAITVGDRIDFNVDENFEANQKLQISAVLVKNTSSLNFYVEKNWWDSQIPAKQSEIIASLDALSSEFNNNIYPNLTSVFGSEWKPGVDGDDRITILFHPMKEGVGGYFRSADEHIKLQVPSSNEREMIYLATNQLDNLSKLKVFLAHELVHLITFNQKDRLLGVAEEIWLNEARAEYAATILGYNNVYTGSNLQSRVRDFVEKPTDSLTEWQESKYDYGVINLFTNYLMDHYGINMFSDSLKSKLVGMASINDVLLKNGYQEDFSQIFTDWTITLMVNNCASLTKYCYLNKHLNNFRINPALVFLPVSGNSSLLLANVTKNWSGNWQKIIGGKGDLKLEFSSLAGLNFKVPYILFDKDNKYSISFLALDNNERGEVNIKEFSEKYNFLIVLPSLQTKMTGFNQSELTYPYTLKLTIGQVAPVENPSIEKLLAEIEALKKQIEELRASSNSNSTVCAKIYANLYMGVLNKAEVTCLQTFLKSQGAGIYPEGLVTGNFGGLTKAAVVRFQEKYKSEILTPAGLTRGTGFVGVFTRVKINNILNEG